jgi:microcin C transport system permease protein
MLAYIVRRLLLIIPTLLGIILLNFAIVQFAPGGPVEQMIARIQGTAVEATARVSGGVGDAGAPGTDQLRGDATANFESKYRGARGLPPEFIEELEKMVGFDKPPHERFILMVKNYVTFDFGNSFFQDRPVVDLVLEKLPVSITIGFWTTVFLYGISIPLGIAKAVRDGTRFDAWTSVVVIAGNALPSFMIAILGIQLFASGNFVDWFPLRGLVSENFDELSLLGKIGDYFLHIALPVGALVIGGYAALTMLTKNSFLDQISQQYVTTARAKGLNQGRVLYGHVFRNAMLIVISGFPAAFLSILFGGALLIEIIFSLDGLGRLGFEAVLNRDYPIVFATLYVFGLMGLMIKLVTDVTYVLVDPRIDFESREV